MGDDRNPSEIELGERCLDCGAIGVIWDHFSIGWKNCPRCEGGRTDPLSRRISKIERRLNLLNTNIGE